jgi:ParB-like nuclease domain
MTRTPDQSNTTSIPISVLDFDPQNPRFFDISSEGKSTEAEALSRMLKEENIDELVGSIGKLGYFTGEPLLVTPNPKNSNRYIVVEGNRRLAALRVLSGMLTDDSLLPSLRDLRNSASVQGIDAVPCFVFPTRKETLKYLGFRHISGPKTWGPLAKARYLADLIQNFYADLELPAQLQAVARDIGSRSDYVAQLLTALNLYERARNKNFYDLQKLSEGDISFSLLSTALSYSKIVKFLELADRKVVNVESINDEHAKQLLAWMFVQDQSGNTVLGESRHLEKLAAVVASPRAVIELNASHNLDQAYAFTGGPGEAFQQRLASAEKAISDCIGLLAASLSPDGQHLQQIERIIDNAENLQFLMQKQISKKARQAEAL